MQWAVSGVSLQLAEVVLPLPLPLPLPIPIRVRIRWPMPFAHEKLDVYNLALDFVALADEVVSQLPRGRGHLADSVEQHTNAKAVLERIAAMLVKLAKAQEGQ